MPNDLPSPPPREPGANGEKSEDSVDVYTEDRKLIPASLIDYINSNAALPADLEKAKLDVLRYVVVFTFALVAAIGTILGGVGGLIRALR